MQTYTLTSQQIHEIALEVAGGMGPVIEKEIGEVPEGYAFPAEQAQTLVRVVLQGRGITVGEDDDTVPGAPIDHSRCFLVSDGQEYAILDSYENVVMKVEEALEAGTKLLYFRSPTRKGTIICAFATQSISRVHQKIAS